MIHFYKKSSNFYFNMGDGCKLFIYGIDQNFQNHELQTEFEKFGTVTDVHNTGKGYAFVTFDQKESADSAIREMDGVTLNGQQIKVNEAKPREGGGRGGRGGTTKTFNLRATFYFDWFLMYRKSKLFQILILFS